MQTFKSTQRDVLYNLPLVGVIVSLTTPLGPYVLDTWVGVWSVTRRLHLTAAADALNRQQICIEELYFGCPRDSSIYYKSSKH